MMQMNGFSLQNATAVSVVKKSDGNHFVSVIKVRQQFTDS
jgi:hypothetical protein